MAAPEFDERERALILDLTAGRIAMPEFVRAFGRNNDSHFVLHALTRITTAKDRENLPHLLYLWGYLSEPREQAHLQILRTLLGEPWHNMHEWVVDLLQKERDPRALPGLFEAAQATYPALDELDQTSLRNRCTYAIDAIGTADADGYLQRLAEIPNETGKLAASLRKTRAK